MKELVLLSPAPDSAKTRLVAALAALAGRCVLGDSALDDAGLAGMLRARWEREEPFAARRWARVEDEECIGCARCAKQCRLDALVLDGPPNELVAKTYRAEPLVCDGCGECVPICPRGGLVLDEVAPGRWLIGRTDYGPLVQVRLAAEAHDPGKVVTLVRDRARRLAEAEGHELLLVDGPAGSEASVVASVVHADAAVIVAGPSADLEPLGRMLLLARHLRVPATVFLARSDLHADAAEQVEDVARKAKAACIRARLDARPGTEAEDSARGAELLWAEVAPR